VYAPLTDRSTRRLLKLMEERYHRHSTIITTNLVYDVSDHLKT